MDFFIYRVKHKMQYLLLPIKFKKIRNVYNLWFLINLNTNYIISIN